MKNIPLVILLTFLSSHSHGFASMGTLGINSLNTTKEVSSVPKKVKVGKVTKTKKPSLSYLDKLRQKFNHRN